MTSVDSMSMSRISNTTPIPEIPNPVTVARALWVTLLLFVILHIAAIVGILWTITPASATGDSHDVRIMPWIVGLVVGLGLIGLLRRGSNVIPLFAVFTVAAEGLFLGGIATYFEGVLPGIVLQVVFALLSVLAAFLPLAASKRFRRLRQGPRVLLLAVTGYLIFAVHNLTLMGMDFIPERTAWGQGSVSVLGIPVGLVLAVLMVPSIAYALARALQRIEESARNKAPSTRAWRSGLDIMGLILWHPIDTYQALSRSRNVLTQDGIER